MLSGLTQTGARQREIAEVVLRNGWGYMRRLLMGRQSDEPEFPTPAVLRKILIELGPVYVKLGQLLSTRPDLLPSAYIDALSTLQSNVPAVPWTAVEPVLQQSLQQPLEKVFAQVQPIAIAAGSIAQVHRATLVDGREVALKIQRPGIDAVVEQDIQLIQFLAGLAGKTDLGQEYAIPTLAAEFCDALKDELNFKREAGFTDELRRNLARSRWIDPSKMLIPAINWEITSEKLLVMEWLEGVPLLEARLEEESAGDKTHTERRSLMTLLFRAFAQQVYVDGFFHADPHPGNIFYIGSGHLALLDCGMVGRLDPNTQRLLTEMLLAIVEIDSRRCAQITLELAGSTQPVNIPVLEQDYERLLRKYYNRDLSAINFSEVFYEILQVARNNKIRLPSSLGLYAKTLANLEGVTRSFDPDINLFEEIKPLMTDLFQKQLVGEAPLQAMLRAALDLKNLSLQSPRQMELILERVTSENLTWRVSLPEIDGVRRTLDAAANRLSFSIVVGALIMGAATITAQTQESRFTWISDSLFIAASVLGLWLIISILRSGQLK
ncbi:ABC1 kinase family protein [Altericista sp. CCNU0014]|uniref:ABC1 kinase family protein n=1 Tax=Altericista sp. CCNU0014 TaxID=3082949 RepID=UPI003851310B